MKKKFSSWKKTALKWRSLPYCQYLISSQINYICTNLADHFENLDQTSVYRYLKDEKLTPRLLWEKVQEQIVFSPSGVIIFDDIVLDLI